MKLILRIALHTTWILSLLLAAWAVVLYFSMVDEVRGEMDDSLESHAELIIRRVLAGDEPATEGGGWRMRMVPEDYVASVPHVVYSDEKILIPGRDEREHARVLRVVFRSGDGSWRELSVMTPTIGRSDLREAILRSVLWLYGVLLVSLLLVDVWLLRRTLRPLYALLRWLDDYRVGAGVPPPASDTTITEFRRLNEAAARSAARAETLFERQKQFIGNASHEMQTPLAVCRNRLEMLVDSTPPLTGEQLGEVAKVQRSLDALVRLNRSLLLLSKIENGQFPEVVPVAFDDLVRTAAGDLEEIYGGRGIRLEIRDEGPLCVRMNPALAASVVNNLLKNAFLHNVAGGRVAVTIAPERLEVRNSAGAGALDAGRLFDRFYRGDGRSEGSTGLGLSIVEAVCRLYGFDVRYRYEGEWHLFAVDFSGRSA